MRSLTRVALIDDHQFLTEPLRLCIDREADLEFVGLAADGDEAIQLIHCTKPDVVLFDVKIPGMDSFSVAQEISRISPHTRIVFLSGYCSQAFVQSAIEIPSTRGYILKGESIPVILQAIRAATRGEFSFSAQVQEMLTFNPQNGRYRLKSSHILSDIQVQILESLVNGMTVKEVARKLGVTHKSADSQIYRMMRKLRVSNRVGLLSYAIREGMVLCESAPTHERSAAEQQN